MECKDIRAGIVSVGTYIPEPYVTADMVAKESGIPREVIETKMAWKRKHIPGPDDHAMTMGVRAAQDALSQSDIDPKDIDVLISTVGVYQDYPFQLSAMKMAHELRADHAWAFDVYQHCSGNIVGLKIAKDFMIANDDVNTVLVTGGFRHGDLIDYRNQRTSFLFNLSAAGGAFLVRKNHPRNHILETVTINDFSFVDDAFVPAGGSRMPITSDALDKRLNYLDCPDPSSMKDRLRPISAKNWVDIPRYALAKSGCSESADKYLALVHMPRVVHDSIVQGLGLRDDQTTYLEEHGHAGTMDLPLLIKLGLESGRIKDGTIVIMVTGGFGFFWSAMVIRWGPDNANR